MQLTGHKTRFVFERYNIVSQGNLMEAAHKLDDFRRATGTNPGTGKGPAMRVNPLLIERTALGR
jgi:hypothetical protein